MRRPLHDAPRTLHGISKSGDISLAAFALKAVLEDTKLVLRVTTRQRHCAARGWAGTQRDGRQAIVRAGDEVPDAWRTDDQLETRSKDRVDDTYHV